MKNMKNDTVNDSYTCRYYQNGMKSNEESNHIGSENVQQDRVYKNYYYDALNQLKSYYDAGAVASYTYSFGYCGEYYDRESGNYIPACEIL